MAFILVLCTFKSRPVSRGQCEACIFLSKDFSEIYQAICFLRITAEAYLGVYKKSFKLGLLCENSEILSADFYEKAAL